MEETRITGFDLCVQHRLRTERQETLYVQHRAVGRLCKVLPQLQRLVPEDDMTWMTRMAWHGSDGMTRIWYICVSVCVCVYRVFRGMEKGKLWKTACLKSGLLLWIIRCRLTDWAPALSPKRVTWIHTDTHSWLLLSHKVLRHFILFYLWVNFMQSCPFSLKKKKKSV